MLKQIIIAAVFGMTSMLTFAGNEYVPGKNYQEVTPGWCPTNGGTCNKPTKETVTYLGENGSGGAFISKETKITFVCTAVSISGTEVPVKITIFSDGKLVSAEPTTESSLCKSYWNYYKEVH